MEPDFWGGPRRSPENTNAITPAGDSRLFDPHVCEPPGCPRRPLALENAVDEAGREGPRRPMWWVTTAPPSRGLEKLRMFRDLPPERVTLLPPRCHSIRPWPRPRGVIAADRAKHGRPRSLCRHGRKLVAARPRTRAIWAALVAAAIAWEAGVCARCLAATGSWVWSEPQVALRLSVFGPQ